MGTVKEIKMGLPDWTKQVGLLLPQPERYVLVTISELNKGLSSSELFESVKEKISKEELDEALVNLKDASLLNYVRTFSEFLDINLTLDGKISAENGGQLNSSSIIDKIEDPKKKKELKKNFEKGNLRRAAEIIKEELKDWTASVAAKYLKEITKPK